MSAAVRTPIIAVKLTQTPASCELGPALLACSLAVREDETLDCGSVSGAWATEHSLSHRQRRGAYTLNFVLQYLCFGFVLLYVNEMGCAMCAVWGELASLVVALVGKGCLFQSYASIYVPTLQFDCSLKV